jgi:pyrimidine operon attenuation protein/uracil phosphoribosyltransferase
MAEHKVLNAGDMERSLLRIAHEILEHNPDISKLRFIGIHTRGIPLARRLSGFLKNIDGIHPPPPVGELDISFHRDDIDRVISVPKATVVPFDIDDRVVILVDDVLSTGRTVRAALNAMIDLGRSRAIQLAVLVDRGHRQLPIRPDYVGKNLPTGPLDNVRVKLREVDGEDCVIVEESQ